MTQGKHVSFMIVIAAVAVVLSGGRALAQDRGGFTALVDVGAGIQNDSAIEETAVGLSGINAGIGGFLNENLALMLRVAGTNVGYDLGGVDYDQVSGFAGPSLQYWLSDKVNVEAGAGVGYWSGSTDEDNQGFGLMLGAGFSVFNRGKHNLQLGAHYAPAFTEPGTVHNFGFTFGYQFQ